MKSINIKKVKNNNSIVEHLRLTWEEKIKKSCGLLQNLTRIMGHNVKRIGNGLRSLRKMEAANNRRQHSPYVSAYAKEARKYITKTVVSYMHRLVPILKPTDDPRCWGHNLVPAEQAQRMLEIRGMSERNIYYHEQRLKKAGVLEIKRNGKRVLNLSRYEEIVSVD